MQKDLISIVVPVYNVEDYLEKCIQSILNQSYKNLEIILVDDGSPDNCPKICDKYEKLDSRIKVIHKKNGGLSDARNIGIKNAKGKYISFVDSDDYIKENFIEDMYNLLIKYDADIACSQMKITNKTNDDVVNENKKINIYSSLDAIKETLYQRNIDNSAPSKLFKKELFDDICFPVGYTFEDLDTVYKVFLKCEKIVVSNYKYYFYYQREDSILHTVKDKTIEDLLFIANNMYSSLEKYEGLKSAVLARLINAHFYVYNRTKNEKYKQDSKEFIIKNRKKVLKDKNISLKTKCGIILSYISFSLMSKIYKLK